MASNMTLSEAANFAGTSESSVRNWLKSEKELAKLVKKDGRKLVFTPKAVGLLKKIADRRKKNAPAGLKKAWAAKAAAAGTKKKKTASKKVAKKSTRKSTRKSTKKVSKRAAAKKKATAKKAARRTTKKTPKATVRAIRVKSKPAPKKKAPKRRTKKSAKRNAGLEKAWAARRAKAAARREEKAAEKAAADQEKSANMSAAEAAGLLGISRFKLYDVMKKSGIKAPGGRRNFTPALVAQLNSVVMQGQTLASKAVERTIPVQVAAAKAAGDLGGILEQAMGSLRQAVESREGEYKKVLSQYFAEQLALIERTRKNLGL